MMAEGCSSSRYLSRPLMSSAQSVAGVNINDEGVDDDDDDGWNNTDGVPCHFAASRSPKWTNDIMAVP